MGFTGDDGGRDELSEFWYDVRQVVVYGLTGWAEVVVEAIGSNGWGGVLRRDCCSEGSNDAWRVARGIEFDGVEAVEDVVDSFVAPISLFHDVFVGA